MCSLLVVLEVLKTFLLCVVFGFLVYSWKVIHLMRSSVKMDEHLFWEILHLLLFSWFIYTTFYFFVPCSRVICLFNKVGHLGYFLPSITRYFSLQNYLAHFFSPTFESRSSITDLHSFLHAHIFLLKSSHTLVPDYLS